MLLSKYTCHMNIYDPLHCYCSLHTNPTLLQTSNKKTTNCKIYLLFHPLPYMHQQEICPPKTTYRPHIIGYISQKTTNCNYSYNPYVNSFDVHQWEKYANTHPIYDSLAWTMWPSTLYIGNNANNGNDTNNNTDNNDAAANCINWIVH